MWAETLPMTCILVQSKREDLHAHARACVPLQRFPRLPSLAFPCRPFPIPLRRLRPCPSFFRFFLPLEGAAKGRKAAERREVGGAGDKVDAIKNSRSVY